MTQVRRDEDAWRMIGEMQREIQALQRLVVPGELITDKRLPENPYDGQIVDVQIVEGINWRFRYNEFSASSKKWEFQFGPPIFDEVTTSESITTTEYAAFTTPGPALTIPFSGDYYIDLGARIISPVAGSDAFVSYTIGTTAADDTDGLNSRQSDATSGHNIRNNYQRRRRKNDLTAGVVLTVQGKHSASSASAGARWLQAQPIRVA